jgi:hypothetical protein
MQDKCKCMFSNICSDINCKTLDVVIIQFINKLQMYYKLEKEFRRLQMTDIYGQLNDDRRLPTLPENLSSPPVFSGIPVARS